MNWKTIFNPFLKFDEKKLLITGILVFGLNIFSCYYVDFANDSIFHYSNLDEDQGIWDILKINSLSYILAVVILFILAKILNGKTRFIDILNTVLISQIPLMVMIPVNGLSFYKKAVDNLSENINTPKNISIADMTMVTIWGFISLILLVYSIVLYYNGFKTATNIKKWQHIVLFAFVSLVITIVSQVIF
ncbi:YIP1 family protein [Chryseobacterium indoltheticum]|uniref:YIP1 family protein n=1 Tax=Chryseobacterium indoltheticum TaxID=254 RepID=UPI0040419431